MPNGETDLSTLLRAMHPVLQESAYVFCTVPHGTSAPDGAVCTFREDEGVTVIVRQDVADAAGLSYESLFRWITLSVHSSLDAVGFLAAVTRALAAHGISTNAVSGYYHDHLFVPAAQAEQALQLLQALS